MEGGDVGRTVMWVEGGDMGGFCDVLDVVGGRR